MRTIAYKLAGDCIIVKNSLPSDHIVEWTYVDLHPEGSLVGFKLLPEDDFNLLLSAQTSDKMNQWLLKRGNDHKLEMRQIADKMKVDEDTRKALKDTHLAEFEEFLAWKKSKP